MVCLGKYLWVWGFGHLCIFVYCVNAFWRWVCLLTFFPNIFVILLLLFLLVCLFGSRVTFVGKQNNIVFCNLHLSNSIYKMEEGFGISFSNEDHIPLYFVPFPKWLLSWCDFELFAKLFPPMWQLTSQFSIFNFQLVQCIIHTYITNSNSYYPIAILEISFCIVRWSTWYLCYNFFLIYFRICFAEQPSWMLAHYIESCIFAIEFHLYKLEYLVNLVIEFVYYILLVWFLFNLLL